MNKTALSSLETLAQTLKSKENHIVFVEIASIVNNSVLSSYQSFTTITGALLTEFDGYYNMKSGMTGHSVIDGKGIILNLGEHNQFFINQSAMIEIRYPDRERYDGLMIVRIKDKRSSMYIHLQIFNWKEETFYEK